MAKKPWRSFLKSLPKDQRRGLRGAVRGMPKSLRKFTKGQLMYNQSNIGQQEDLNRIAIEGPTGSSRWETDPETGERKITTQLGDQEQRIYDTHSGYQGDLADTVSTQLDQTRDIIGSRPDMSSLPEAPINQDLATERQRIEDATYGRLTRDFDDRFSREEERLRSRLLNSGHDIGSPRYQQAMDEFRQSKNDAFQDARAQAIGMGGQEWQRSYNIGSDARSRGLGEMFGLRNQSLQELGGLAGLQRGPMMPQQTPFTQINTNPMNLFGAAQNQMQFDQDMAYQNRALGMRGGGGGGGFMAPPSLPPLPPSVPSQPSPWSDFGMNIGGGLAGGIGTGFGNWLGDYFGG